MTFPSMVICFMTLYTNEDAQDTLHPFQIVDNLRLRVKVSLRKLEWFISRSLRDLHSSYSG